MNNRSIRIFWGSMFVLFGALLLARNLGYIELHHAIRTYWPLVLVLIGLNIVLKSLRKSSQQ